MSVENKEDTARRLQWMREHGIEVKPHPLEGAEFSFYVHVIFDDGTYLVAQAETEEVACLALADEMGIPTWKEAQS